MYADVASDPIVQLAQELQAELRSACLFGSLGVVRELCASHQIAMCIDVPGAEGRTVLLDVCAEGRHHAAELLVAAGADCNATDPRGRSALMLAGWSGEVALLGPLLTSAAEPADAFARAADGWTALMHACARGHVAWSMALLQQLAKGGAPRDQLRKLVAHEDADGRSAVDLARTAAHARGTPAHEGGAEEGQGAAEEGKGEEAAPGDAADGSTSDLEELLARLGLA